MVKKWNKEKNQFDVVHPYTKVEMLDMYKWLNAPPLVIYSQRWNSADRKPYTAEEITEFHSKLSLFKPQSKYVILYKENGLTNYYQDKKQIFKFDNKKDAEEEIERIRNNYPNATDWRLSQLLFKTIQPEDAA